MRNNTSNEDVSQNLFKDMPDMITGMRKYLKQKFLKSQLKVIHTHIDCIFAHNLLLTGHKIEGVSYIPKTEA